LQVTSKTSASRANKIARALLRNMPNSPQHQLAHTQLFSLRVSSLSRAKN
jgi:hypothetical protein